MGFTTLKIVEWDSVGVFGTICFYTSTREIYHIFISQVDMSLFSCVQEASQPVGDHPV